MAWLRCRCGLSGPTLVARFKRRLRRTPRQYIEDARLSAAQHLMRTTRADLPTIALHVGYEEYRTFARAFKRYTGRSPQAYRSRSAEPEEGRAQCREASR